MEPMLAAFREAARKVRYREPSCRLLSNVTGQPFGARAIDAEYWVQHVRKPVRFADCVQHLQSTGIDILIEIGPSPVLLALAGQCAGAAFRGLPSLRPGKGAREQMLESLGAAWVAGCQPNLRAVADERAGERPRLPTYPFQRKRHWLPAAPRKSPVAARAGDVPDGDVHPFLGLPVSSPLRELQYECSIDIERTPVLREHRIAGTTIFPAAAFIELGCAAARELYGLPTARIEGGWLRSALILDEAGRQDVRLVVTPGDGAAVSRAVVNQLLRS
jgi:acyl transferase domain-containing protein